MDAISSAIKSVQDRFPNVRCKLEEPMKNHTSFKIGGPVRAMFFPECDSSLTALHSLLCGYGITPFVMGKGTNLLADDKALDIVVINTAGLGGIGCSDTMEIKAGAGVLLSMLSVYACEHGLSGLEFAHGIPGTLGGAVAMNAGAYEGEMKDVVHSSSVYSPKTGTFTVTGTEHMFSYRRSRFTDTDEVIVSSVIRLQSGDVEGIRALMSELNERRSGSQPLELPSAGSTFKRPKEGYAARFIEQAGLKGFTIGGAQVSKKHSGFVVNCGGASYSDVMAVIGHVQETVFKQYGIELELEVRILTGR